MCQLPGLNPDSTFVISSEGQPFPLEDRASRPSFPGSFEGSQTTIWRLAEVTYALISDCPLFTDDCSGHTADPRRTPKRILFWAFKILRRGFFFSGFIFLLNRKFTYPVPLTRAIQTLWQCLHSKKSRHNPPYIRKRHRESVDVSCPTPSVQPHSCGFSLEATTVAPSSSLRSFLMGGWRTLCHLNRFPHVRGRLYTVGVHPLSKGHCAWYHSLSVPQASVQ